VTVAKEKHGLRLGSGTAFDKGRLKRLRQGDDAWEADLLALPKPVTRHETHNLRMAVSKRGGPGLAETQVGGRPSADDMAALIARAMRRPLNGRSRRSRRLYVRGQVCQAKGRQVPPRQVADALLSSAIAESRQTARRVRLF